MNKLLAEVSTCGCLIQTKWIRTETFLTVCSRFMKHVRRLVTRGMAMTFELEELVSDYDEGTWLSWELSEQERISITMAELRSFASEMLNLIKVEVRKSADNGAISGRLSWRIEESPCNTFDANGPVVAELRVNYARVSPYVDSRDGSWRYPNGEVILKVQT